MRTSLTDMLATHRVLLSDGATGTNFFGMGLESGDPPEFWNVDQPERVKLLHQGFVDAGADIILTNTFGCNRHRLKLHKAESRTFELAKRAAELAREVADACDRPVVVAGSVGPTGELFEPLGALTSSEAIDTFAEQIAGLKAGGADVAWIETMSAIEEVRAAANGAIAADLPYTVTCSFDTAGRTMMGLMPDQLVNVFDGLSQPPIAYGSNCGVGASDILVSLLAMTDNDLAHQIIVKGNCGIPQFIGTEIHYSGTPGLMATYAELAVFGGARIIGGCCGTSSEHLAAMRAAIDAAVVDAHAFDSTKRPTITDIVAAIGPLANQAPSAIVAERPRRRTRVS
jgi:5-methyltetrahydrofolate--homocysteine methyltransferase